MTTPVRLVTCMYVPGDGWVDISTRVRQATGSRVFDGRTQESGEVVPAEFEAQLDDRDGVLSPRYPGSPYYLRIGQGTPIRHAIGGPADTFGVPVVDGWGTTSVDGRTWATFGASGTVQASDWQVAAGVGTHSVPAVAASRSSYLTGYAARDVDVAVTVSLAISDVTGGDLEPAGVLLRGQSTTDYYLVRVAITTAEAVTVGLRHADGTVLAAAVTVPGVTHTAAQALRVRAVIEGQTLAARVWPVDDPEPYGWHVTAHVDLIDDAGWVGVRSGVAASNSNAVPVVFSYDDVAISYPLFHGTALEMPPRWDQSGTDLVAALSAAGPTAGITAGTDPLQSSPRRYIPTSRQAITGQPRPPVAYWPLEDGPLVSVGAPVVGVHPMVLASPSATSRQWGQGDLGPHLNKGLALLGGDTVAGKVSLPNVTLGDVDFAVDHVRCGDPTDDTRLLVTCSTPGLGTPQQTWEIEFVRTAGTPHGVAHITWAGPSSGSSTNIPAPRLWDGQAHHVRFFVSQSGADIGLFLDLDADNVLGIVVSSVTILPPVEIALSRDAGSGSEPYAVGHATVYGLTRPTVDFAQPVLGWVGETTVARTGRLCDEHGLTFGWRGDAATATAMGPQRPIPLPDLLREPAASEGGSLTESRGIGGVVLRLVDSLTNQPAALTLDYAVGELAEVPIPRDDDRDVRNRWTVRRINGGEYVAELATGRLSTAAPQDGGIGPAPDVLEVSVASDAQLRAIGDWQLHLSTVDELRWPSITVEVRALDELRGLPDIAAAALSVGIDDLIEVVNPPVPAGAPETLRLLVRGREVLADSQRLRITWSCTPASPYDVFVLEAASGDLGRLADDGTSTLTSGVSAEIPGAVDTLSVATASGPLWTTDPTDLPLTVEVGGERITVTDITGTTSPQTFDVERGANGISKAHDAGAVVRLVGVGVIGR